MNSSSTVNPLQPANPFQPAFESPEAEHTACPFWFWNGDMEPSEIIRQIGLMVDKGIRGFVIHARVGLSVPYLSEMWFERCELTLSEAARHGMKVWLYDEDNWPSGYAGGRVLERDPSFIGQNLGLVRHYLRGGERWQPAAHAGTGERFAFACRIESVNILPPDPLHFQGKSDLGLPWSDLSGHEHVYATTPPLVLDSAAEWIAPDGDWCVMELTQQPTNWIAAYSNHAYTDLMNDKAMDAFIEATHEQYFQRFSAYFGSTILGFFVDEPGLYNNFWDRNVASLSWTHDFAEQFMQRRGYDLRSQLPALWENLGHLTETLRVDYWQTVSDLLDERFFSKLALWCEVHGVQLTGHLEWEEWMFTMTRHSASPFRALSPFHVPGVDKIDEVTDKLSEKLVASVAHINGQARVLSETFALTGWKLAPPYMKRIVDQQYVRGINWLSCHGFYYSTDDFRKRECPPSEFFQNPWWDHSQPLWSYVARLSAALSQGQHVAPVALYYPTEHAWATITPDAPVPSPMAGIWEPWQLPDPQHPTQRSDLSMIHTGLHLLETQWDFDLLDHAALEGATVEGGKLTVGNESFGGVVLPAMDAIHASTLHQLFALAESGGTVVFVNRLPDRILIGDAPDAWVDLRARLSSLSAPALIPVGLGKIGFVPTGVAALAPLLETALRPDVRLTIHPEDDRWLSTLENRNGIQREARIKPLRHTIKYHRRHHDSFDLYFVTNESAESFGAHLELRGGARVELWNPKTGVKSPLPSQAIGDDRVRLELHFGAWESHLLALTSAAPNAPVKATLETRQLELHDWRLELAGQSFDGALRSWAALGLSSFSGIGVYTTSFDWAGNGDQSIWLDLGVVLETARVTLNGTTLEPQVWQPYRAEISSYMRAGRNELQIEVANTNANAFEGRERPSGLLGPVWISSSGES